MGRQSRRNPSRRIAPIGETETDDRQRMAGAARYTGSPMHKRDPSNYGLTPLVSPRPDKTLCDMVNTFTREDAQKLLQKGIVNGTVSASKSSGGWPKTVWAVMGVSRQAQVFEAKLENPSKGTYHGYPLALESNDRFKAEIIRRWSD